MMMIGCCSSGRARRLSMNERILVFVHASWRRPASLSSSDVASSSVIGRPSRSYT
jgi:hypothetical protein